VAARQGSTQLADTYRLQAMSDNEVVVKLDFSNAFNSLHRSDMLQAVRDRIPELLLYCYSSYAQPSMLFSETDVVLSQEHTATRSHWPSSVQQNRATAAAITVISINIGLLR